MLMRIPRPEELSVPGQYSGSAVIDRPIDEVFAGMKSNRRFELTGFAAPTTIRWTERSKNLVTVTEGGYDLEDLGDSKTKVTVFNSFAGHGFGKLIVGSALKSAAKDADAFAQRIKAAVEAS
jgi:hypothetical protein